MYNFNWQFTMAHPLDRVDLLFGKLKALRPLSKENQQRLDKKFRLEFNYNSNHMEGNTLTYDETALLLMFDDTRGNHSMRELEEMKAHDAAYRLIEEWASESERPLTEQSIRSLNETILVKPFWKEAITPDGKRTRREIKIGSYKEYPNSVRLENGSIFEYASPAETPILMQELIEWYRSEESSLHPVALASLLHYKFVIIHPFDDGNGRVARLLMNYVLIRNGYPPAIIKSEDKQNYLRSLRIADAGDYESLITYIADQVTWSLEISIKAAKGESIDEPGDLDKKFKALKQRLNADQSTKIRITKNTASLNKAYEIGIKPLIDSISEKLSELSPLFKSTRENLEIVGHHRASHPDKDVKNFYAHIENHGGGNVSQLSYSIRFEGLRRIPKGNFSCSIFLAFEFHENLYELVSEALSTHFDKLYDETFSHQEMTQITEELGNNIVDQIERIVDQKDSR
jgi:Fic family protein